MYMETMISVIVVLSGISMASEVEKVTTTSSICQPCHDFADFCKQSENIKDLCDSNMYFSNYVRSECPLSCGICQPCNPCEGGTSCRDKSVYCSAYKSLDFCSRPNLQPFMKQTCPKSCDFCEGCQATKRSCSLDCKDDNDICEESARSKGYCDPVFGFSQWMHQNCRKSCGLCIPCSIEPKDSTDKVPEVVPVPKPFVFN